MGGFSDDTYRWTQTREYKLEQAVKKIWDAYIIYVSAGSTSSSFNRHILPAIQEAKLIADKPS